MADATKEYQIKLTTSAETEGAKATAEALQKVGDVAAEATAAGVEKASSALEEQAKKLDEVTTAARELGRVIDMTGPLVGPRLEDGNFTKQWVAATNEAAGASREYAQEMNKAAAAIMAAGQEEEKVLSIAEQRQILAHQLLEAVEATAAGDAEGAAWMMREVEIRRAAIALQQQAGLTEAEALALAARKVQAEEAVLEAKQKQVAADKEAKGGAEGLMNALQGGEVSWKRTIGHAQTLGNQLVQGNVSLAGMTSTLGSIAPMFAGITLAVGAAVKGAEKLLEMEAAVHMQHLKNGEEAAKWAEIFTTARVGPEDQALSNFKAKQEELKALNAEFSRSMAERASKWHALKATLSEVSGGFVNAAKRFADPLGTIDQQLKETFGEDFLRVIPDAEALDPLISKISDLSGKLALLKHGIESRQAEKDKAQALEEEVKAREALTKEADKNYQALNRLDEQARQQQFDALPAEERMESLAGKIATVREALRDLHADAATPMEAGWIGQGLPAEERARVAELALEWQRLQTAFSGAQKDQAGVLAKRTEEAVKLREELERVQASIPKLEADLADMQAAGNRFVQVRNEGERGAMSYNGWYRKDDVAQNASGMWMPNAGATAVAANDSDLMRWQQATAALEEARGKLTAGERELAGATAAAGSAASAVATGQSQVAEAIGVQARAATEGMQATAQAANSGAAQVQAQAGQVVAAVAGLQQRVVGGFEGMIAALNQTNNALDGVTRRIAALERRAMQ